MPKEEETKEFTPDFALDGEGILDYQGDEPEPEVSF